MQRQSWSYEPAWLLDLLDANDQKLHSLDHAQCVLGRVTLLADRQHPCQENQSRGLLEGLMHSQKPLGLHNELLSLRKGEDFSK